MPTFHASRNTECSCIQLECALGKPLCYTPEATERLSICLGKSLSGLTESPPIIMFQNPRLLTPYYSRRSLELIRTPFEHNAIRASLEFAMSERLPADIGPLIRQLWFATTLCNNLQTTQMNFMTHYGLSASIDDVRP